MVNYIETATDLKRALKKLGLSRQAFASLLEEKLNQRITAQAVWKWLRDKNKRGFPGYVGHFLHAHFNLNRDTLK